MVKKNKKLVSKSKEKNPFLEYFRRRIRRNKNCIIAIVGETGSGKSYAALKLAENLDPKFNIDRVALKADEFLKALKADVPKGSVIVFDEAGVAWQSRNFMNFINKSLSYALQTVRFKNHIIIVTVPDISFIDAQGRKLLHMLIITEKIIMERSRARLRPYIISISHRTGEVYKITPRINRNGKVIKMHKIEVGLPSVALRHAYEKKKRLYAEELYNKTYRSIRKDIEKDLNVLSPNHRTVFELDKAGLKSAAIARILKVGLRRVYDIRKENKVSGFIPDKIVSE